MLTRRAFRTLCKKIELSGFSLSTEIDNIISKHDIYELWCEACEDADEKYPYIDDDDIYLDFRLERFKIIVKEAHVLIC